MAPKGEKKERKRSSVWAYMEKRNADIVVCVLCRREFKYNSCTTNMLKHIRSKHRSAYEEMNDGDTTQEGSGSNAIHELGDQSHAETPQHRVVTVGLAEKDTAKDMKVKKYRSRSIVWEHFMKSNTEGNAVACLHCRDQLIRGGGTSNLLKHLQRKHPLELDKSRLNEILRSRSPSPAREVEDDITSSKGNPLAHQEAAEECQVQDDAQEFHMPVIRIDESTFAVVDDEIAENGVSAEKTPVKEKSFPAKKKFRKGGDLLSSSGLQFECLKLQREKLILEISKLETETIFMKEKLKLEIEKLKEEKEKAKSEKELMKLSVTRAKREMGIKE